MEYESTDFSRLLDLDGFSTELMETHIKLYNGYVKNTNGLIARLRDLAQEDKVDTPEYAEMRRRFGWEFNGMRLHELYFGNMTPKDVALDDGGRLADKVKEDFGSVDGWRDEFVKIGAMRGIGWVCLYHDPVRDVLHNVWIDEHDTGQLAGCTPLLLMDVFEHAFMRDFGTDRGAYIEAFFGSVDWKVVDGRLRAAHEAAKPVAPTAIGG